MLSLKRFIKSKKYLSHTYKYDIDGEDLPNKQKKINKKALSIVLTTALIAFFAVNYIIVSYQALFKSISDLNSPTLFDILDLDWNSAFKVENIFALNLRVSFYMVILITLTLLGLFLYFKLNYKSEEGISYGQKGDSRLTKLDEIKTQYPSIPHSQKTFKGIGGVPISHYENNYFIDRDTVNTCILGVSRSGKGEIVITPMIDILSRAEEKSSMILNDPKGELYAGAKDTLEQRGYDVQVLNIQDPLQSMSYNPLQLVKEAWIQGDEQEAGKRANSIAFTLYNDPNAGENSWANEGAQSAVTAIIIAVVEDSIKNKCPEKITMYNVAEMLNELGQLYYKENEEDFTEKNALDEFFKNLPQGHVAKKKYGSTSFSGEKARGSILSVANQGLQPFIDPLFAKMTSENSLDLKQIGFNKSLKGQLDNSFTNKRIKISFHKNDNKKTELGSYNVKVKDGGHYSINFPEKLEENDLILIKYAHNETNHKLIYKISFDQVEDKDGNVIYRKEEGKENLPELKREAKITQLVNTFPVVQRKLELSYSDKPSAVFMIVPDYDSSNHTLVSIFIKQLYTELASNCVETKGKKCFTRVHFILDEFGNMPPIDDMDQVVTVCLGRNILFNLVIQSYTQLKRKYGDSFETIKENCQNHIYIMSTNDDTIEELSKKAGHKTVTGHSSNESYAEVDNKITKSADQVRLLTPDRLSQLLEGETLVIRSLHRQDNTRKKVRPYPIFNTRETNMPYRWEFLGHWLDTSKDLNDIDIPSKHTNLSLQELSLKLEDFIVDLPTRKKFIELNERHRKSKLVVPENESEIDQLVDGILTYLGENELYNEIGYVDLLHMLAGNEMPDNSELIDLSLQLDDQNVVSMLRKLIKMRELIKN